MQSVTQINPTPGVAILPVDIQSMTVQAPRTLEGTVFYFLHRGRRDTILPRVRVERQLSSLREAERRDYNERTS